MKYSTLSYPAFATQLFRLSPVIPTWLSTIIAAAHVFFASIMRATQFHAAFRLAANFANRCSFVHLFMKAVRSQFKIFNTIIRALSVPMMNKLACKKFSTKMAAHHTTMLKNISSFRCVWQPKQNISSTIQNSSPFPVITRFGVYSSPCHPTCAASCVFSFSVTSALAATINAYIPFAHSL